MSQHWESVVSAALVGVTGRTISGTADPAVARYLDGTADPTQLVLRTAALMSVGHNAITPIGPDTVPMVSPAPTDPRPVMSTAAGAIAVRAYSIAPDVAADVRRQLIAADRAPTPELLRLLLSVDDPAAALELDQIIGPPGHWILTHSRQSTPLKQPNFDTADQQTWTLGTTDQRVAYLTALRATDPSRARTLVTDGWSGMPGPERDAVIATFGIGLSPADEEFLESALRDRRKAVRTGAARLLGTLPDSALVGRLFDYLCTVVRPSASNVVEFTLVGHQPPESLARDGISLTPPRVTSRRVHVLTQVIAIVPLHRWETLLDADPATIVAAINPDVADEVIPWLINAAVAQQNPVWAAALAPHQPANHELAAVLGDTQLLAVAHHELSQLNQFGALGVLPTPWPADIADAALTRLEHLASRNRPVDAAAHNLLALMRCGLPIADATDHHPSRAAARITALATTDVAWGWPNALAVLTETLQLRSALARELS